MDNGRHDINGGLNIHNPRNAVLPDDYVELFERARTYRNPTDEKMRYDAKNANGNYHHFQADGGGIECHWNGQANGRTLSGRRTSGIPVPASVRKQLGE